MHLNQDSTYDMLATLFTSFLSIKLVRLADRTEERVLPVPISFILDEFPNIGVVPDFKKKLPGKGIYVTNSRRLLQKAIEKNLFAKAAKQKAKVAPELDLMVEQLLRRHALDAVSLARKAGVLVTGLEKVLEAIKKDKVAFVSEAKDAGDDGHQRIVLAARELEIFRLFDIEELDTALNKVNTVHAAFLKGEMAKMVHNEFNKLADFLNS